MILVACQSIVIRWTIGAKLGDLGRDDQPSSLHHRLSTFALQRADERAAVESIGRTVIHTNERTNSTVTLEFDSTFACLGTHWLAQTHLDSS